MTALDQLGELLPPLLDALEREVADRPLHLQPSAAALRASA